MPDIDVLAVYPSRRHLSAKVRVMVDFLVEVFRPAPPWEVSPIQGVPEKAIVRAARHRRVK